MIEQVGQMSTKLRRTKPVDNISNYNIINHRPRMGKNIKYLAITFKKNEIM